MTNLKTLKKDIAPFEKATTKESIWQIINTVGPFVLLWILAYQSLSVSYWLSFSSYGDSCWIFNKNFHYIS